MALMDATNSFMQWANLIAAAALILTATGACSEPAAKSDRQPGDAGTNQSKPPPITKRPRADRDALQSLATAGCECEVGRRKPGTKDCWSDYRTAAQPFRPGENERAGQIASACAPVSTLADCLIDADGEFCVVTGYNAAAVGRLCRQTEAAAVEWALNAEFEKPGGNQKRAESAAKKALAAVRAGKATKAPASSSGCV
jgi:hypothetical protein